MQKELFEFGFQGDHLVRKITVEELTEQKKRQDRTRALQQILIKRINEAQRYKIRQFKRTFHLRLEFDHDPKLAAMTVTYDCSWAELGEHEPETWEALQAREVIPDGESHLFQGE